MNTAIKWIVSPEGSPVDVERFKWYARIDEDETERLEEILEAATMMCQRYSGRAVMPQVIQYTVRDWPVSVVAGGLSRDIYSDAWIELPWGPITGILSVQSYDIDGTLKNVDYKTDSNTDSWMVLPLSGQNIVIDYVAGMFGEYVPEEMTQAILMVALRIYENRGDCDKFAAIEQSGAKQILDTLKRSW